MTAAFPSHNDALPSDGENPGRLGVAVRVAGGLLAALFLAVVVLLMLGSRRPPLAGLAQARLADGTWASVVHVTVGARHDWQPPDNRTAVEWSLGRTRPRPITVATPFFGSLREHLVIWLVRHDGRTAHPLHWPDLMHARLDAAGERLYPDFVHVHRAGVGTGEWNTWTGRTPIPPSPSAISPGSSPAHLPAEDCVYAIAFPKPPAGCGPLQLHLLGRPGASGTPLTTLATISIAEPAGLSPKATWTPSPLPVTSTVGPHALTLSTILAHNNADKTTDEFRQNCGYIPKLELTDHGIAVPTRLIEIGPVTDAAGNVHRQIDFPGLRPIFPPHRLEVRAVVPTVESLRAESAIEIAGLAIPADNLRAETSLKRSMRDERIRFQTIAIGGMGSVLHDVPTLAAEPRGGLTSTVDGERVEIQELTTLAATGTRPSREIQIDGRVVHLLYDISGLTVDEVAQVTAVIDDQGRSVPFTDTRFRNLRVLFLKPEPDAQGFRLRCELIDTARFEFLVAPPAAGGPPLAKPAAPAPAESP